MKPGSPRENIRGSNERPSAGVGRDPLKEIAGHEKNAVALAPNPVREAKDVAGNRLRGDAKMVVHLRRPPRIGQRDGEGKGNRDRRRGLIAMARPSHQKGHDLRVMSSGVCTHHDAAVEPESGHVSYRLERQARPAVAAPPTFRRRSRCASRAVSASDRIRVPSGRFVIPHGGEDQIHELRDSVLAPHHRHTLPANDSRVPSSASKRRCMPLATASKEGSQRTQSLRKSPMKSRPPGLVTINGVPHAMASRDALPTPPVVVKRKARVKFK